MTRGFIFPAVSFLVWFIHRLSIVEVWKSLFEKIQINIFNKKDDEAKITAKNIAIDSFIIFKWTLIAIFILLDVNTIWAKWLVYYLIFFNLFSYFYHHVWDKRNYNQHKESKTDNTDAHERHPDWQRRRFVTFLLSVAFYLFCYAYLFYSHFNLSINWPDDSVSQFDALYLSVANAFTLTYGDFLPLDQSVRVIFLTELINTFFFFTIIVVNSIPSHPK